MSIAVMTIAQVYFVSQFVSFYRTLTEEDLEKYV